MYYMPFGIPNYGNERSASSAIDELDKTIQFYEAMKKSFNEDRDKDKKKEPIKNKTGDIITTAMFFTFATPFIMLGYGYLMTNMLLSVLESLAKIKGLH